MFRLLLTAVAGALVAVPPVRSVQPDAPRAPATNVVLRGATVFDGSGAPGAKADVHIKGDRVAAVGKVEKVEGATELDAAGLYVCPGFIDLHTHCDTGSPALTDAGGRPNQNYVTQGVTTVVTGNCGSGPVDVARFFAALEAGGVGTNVIHQAPHNSIRSQVMGNENRAPTADELKRMEELVERALDAGAVGL
ncbi:amidohydrolase family protein, partial [bacterium]|nr:amidohydrolase family protein [bacterium]